MPIKTALPLSLIWLLLPMPGWKPAHCPACFPFPTFQQMIILIEILQKSGLVSMRDPHCSRTRVNLGRTSRMGPGEVRVLIVLSLSVLFFPSSGHTAHYLEILTYLNVNEPLSGDEVHSRLLSAKTHLFFLFFIFFSFLFFPSYPKGFRSQDGNNPLFHYFSPKPTI